MPERLIRHTDAQIENIRRIERGKMSTPIKTDRKPYDHEGKEGEMRVYKDKIYVKNNKKWSNSIYQIPVYDYEPSDTIGDLGDVVVIVGKE